MTIPSPDDPLRLEIDQISEAKKYWYEMVNILYKDKRAQEESLTPDQQKQLEELRPWEERVIEPLRNQRILFAKAILSDQNVESAVKEQIERKKREQLSWQIQPLKREIFEQNEELKKYEEAFKYYATTEFSDRFYGAKGNERFILVDLFLDLAEQTLGSELTSVIEQLINQGWASNIRNFLSRLPEVLSLRKKMGLEGYGGIEIEKVMAAFKNFDEIISAADQMADRWLVQFDHYLETREITEEEYYQQVDRFINDKENQNNLFFQLLTERGLLEKFNERLRTRFTELSNQLKTRRLIKQRITKIQEEINSLQQKPIEISQEEMTEAFKRELITRLGRTSLGYWVPDNELYQIFPRCIRVNNPQPREEMWLGMTRGFGGSALTDSLSGDLFLYFPAGQGEIVNIDLHKIEPDRSEGRDGYYIETYDVTEKKPDGSLEEYQMIVDFSGVTFICEGGNKTFVPFGEAQPLIHIVRKPVIYFYSRKKRKVKFEINFKGKVSFVYPRPRKNLSWELEIIGEKIFYEGKEYPYLFWDGKYHISNVDLKEGFVVRGEEVSSFLESKLGDFGLNQKEITDFITYWSSFLVDSPWVFIRFDHELYDKIADLHLTPSPDRIIRVFVLFKKLDKKISVKNQELRKENSFLRSNLDFVVVDWGGVIL